MHEMLEQQQQLVMVMESFANGADKVNNRAVREWMCRSIGDSLCCSNTHFSASARECQTERRRRELIALTIGLAHKQTPVAFRRSSRF